MNNKIFIITVFISNIAFGAILPIATIQKTSTQKNTSKISDKVSKTLYSRGIERKIANKKVEKTLLNNERTTDLMAQNILKSIKSIKETDIIAFISHAALKGKNVDLSSYSTLIALLQKSTGSLIDSDTVQTIEKLSNENEKLKLQEVIL
ncbi:hypothetical protein [Sulfurimonas sp.]|uniref:hypothetical protein n=1 Tax=Sulfurimonas sp. TaxID=2022749 RepID=UPI002602FC9A|nr:hypothetical protein [Sulfurimonas sp.]